LSGVYACTGGCWSLSRTSAPGEIENAVADGAEPERQQAKA
jgi:hypothetical protein